MLHTWNPRRTVDVLAGLLILAALAVALTKTSDLTAPHDWDHFRDIALAQTVRDGAPLSDQYYRDEWVWYNPLLPWTLAIGSAIAGASVEVFHVRAGPWLQLLGPLAFYMLGVRCIGRTAAFIALAIYLFFAIGDGPAWAYATYSPWLYSNDFAAGIFFAAALALLAASDRPTPTRTVCAGAIMGLTFLAHTAPALILVALACAVFARRRRSLLITGATAFIVASPFLYPIGTQYFFTVVHTIPLSWQWEALPTLNALPEFLKDNAILVGLTTLGALVTPSRFLLVWLAAATALLLYAISSTAPVIPAFHFWKWATAAMTFLAGAALAWLCHPTRISMGGLRQPAVLPSRQVNLLAVSLTVAAVVWHWPVYVNRGDFEPERIHRDRDDVAAVEFLREVTGTDDVVLGNIHAVLTIIGPAGRKTVAPDEYFANPYVPYAPRARARDGMLAAINAGDAAAYNELAHQYEVTTAVSLGPEECAAAFRILPPLARFGDVCVSGYSRDPDSLAASP